MRSDKALILQNLGMKLNLDEKGGSMNRHSSLFMCFGGTHNFVASITGIIGSI